MKKKKIIIITAVLVSLSIIAYIYIKTRTVPVQEIPFVKRDIKLTVSASGLVVSEKEATLSFATLGRVTDIPIEKGQRVQKGTYLFGLDSFPETQMSQSYKDTRDIALRELELFIENYETNVDAIGGQDEYDIQLRIYKENVSKAEAAYQSQLGSVARRYIYAPFSGQIIDIFKEVGETALTGEAIIKLADMDNLVFEIVIDQQDYGFIKEGQEVEITLDSYPDKTFVGNIAKLPEYAGGNGSQDFVLKIEFSGEDKNLVLLGMLGDAYIVLASTENEEDSLTYDEILYDIDNKPYVYVLREGIVTRQDVEIGLEGDIYSVVNTDINDPIIKPASDKVELKEGMKAKIIK